MSKISFYLQDDIHGEAFYEYIKKNSHLIIDAYINSPEYQGAIVMGAEHLVSNNICVVRSAENNNYHLEIIVKNEQSRDDLLRKEKRKT